MVRRISKRTRNHRSIPDTWEASQLEKFESMAKGGAPRTQFDIIKPDGSTLSTREYESYAIVDGYFRYMRSIVTVWSTKDQKLLMRFVHSDLTNDFKTAGGVYLRDIEFSPDGAFLATAGADDTARVWNLETKVEVRPSV